jgi:hypothetical protein
MKAMYIYADFSVKDAGLSVDWWHEWVVGGETGNRKTGRRQAGG